MTAFDHVKLNEQQQAVLDAMRNNPLVDGDWCLAYDLVGRQGNVNGKWVTIGDAGRRMRELREVGILESRKRGRYEEYKIVEPPKLNGRLF